MFISPKAQTAVPLDDVAITSEFASTIDAATAPIPAPSFAVATTVEFVIVIPPAPIAAPEEAFAQTAESEIESTLTDEFLRLGPIPAME
jgi:hypothetical protein